MKLRVAFYLLLVFSFSFTLSLSSSAADEDLNEVYFDDYGAYQEYLYYDFSADDVVIYDPYVDEDGNVWDNSPAAYTLSEPNYSDFDISLIDLSTIPEYIQDIINSDSGGVVVQVWSNTYRVFVTNYGAFYFVYTSDASSGSLTRSNGMFSFCTASYGLDGYDPACYYAIYNKDGSINTDWQMASLGTFSSPYYNSKRPYDMRFFGLLADDRCDFYYYGNFFYYLGGSLHSSGSMSYAGDASTGSTLYCVQISCTPSVVSDVIYVGELSSFPTFDSQNLEVNRSIFQKLADIPDLIAEKLRSLFLPEDGYFDAYMDELDLFFSVRLGMLIEIPEAFVDVIGTLIDYEPETEVYKIDIPQINSGYVDENGEFVEYTVIEEQEYVFDFLNEGAFATLYEFYRGFVWCLYVFLLLNLIWRKADKFFGGDSG